MGQKTHTIDASGKSTGRLATQIACLLIGKHKVTYRPNIDDGDKVIVKKADQLKISPRKLEEKKYYHYSGYPGGLKAKSMKELWQKNSAEILRRAVYQMLPKNKLRKPMMKKLKIE